MAKSKPKTVKEVRAALLQRAKDQQIRFKTEASALLSSASDQKKKVSYIAIGALSLILIVQLWSQRKRHKTLKKQLTELQENQQNGLVAPARNESSIVSTIKIAIVNFLIGIAKQELEGLLKQYTSKIKKGGK